MSKGTSRGQVASQPLTSTLLCSSRTAAADALMEACCTDGHHMATQHRDCSLPYASESKECRCVRRRPLSHQHGVPLAGSRVCPEPWQGLGCGPGSTRAVGGRGG